jgi:hypothetical protein
VIGLLLKHIYGLSDEGVCERWVYDPYFQHFAGEAFFQHEFPHERSDLSHWRKRLGDKHARAQPVGSRPMPQPRFQSGQQGRALFLADAQAFFGAPAVDIALDSE